MRGWLNYNLALKRIRLWLHFNYLNHRYISAIYCGAFDGSHACFHEFAGHRFELISFLIEVFVVDTLFKMVGFRRDTSLGLIIMEAAKLRLRHGVLYQTRHRSGPDFGMFGPFFKRRARNKRFYNRSLVIAELLSIHDLPPKESLEPVFATTRNP